jgi:hypothetical protein
MEFSTGSGRALWIAVLFLAGLSSSVPALAKEGAASVCASDEDEDDSKPKPAWKQFAFAGACVELSGEVSFIYQKLLDSKGDAIPVFSTRRGPVFRPGRLPNLGLGLFPQGQTASQPSYLNTLDFSVRVDTTRKTAAGDLTTGFEVQYEKTSDDGDSGIITLTEGIVQWAGVTAGYTDSLMNFWSGDFQFSATAPQRTVAVASYDFKLTDSLKLTLAAETGVPTSRENPDAFAPVGWDDPVAAARLYYETDDLTMQLAGMYHEIAVGGGGTFLARFGRGHQERLSGWAATFGLTKPTPKISEGSEFSMQVTYAVNASSYLGTTGDLSTFSAVIPMPGETRGWSVVGSYHHVWSEHWESNVMASHIALDITLPHLAPSAKSTRYAANLIWKPVESLQIGGELGWVDFTLKTNGALGFFPIESGSALVSYLFVTWKF